MDPAEELLRRLAINDEAAVESVLIRGAASPTRADGERTAPRPGRSAPAISSKVALLVRLGALMALGASTASLRRTVELARGAGADEEELVGVLIAVAPTVGLARVVAAAPRLASAIGYDLAADE